MFTLTTKHLDLYDTMAENGVGRGCNDLDTEEIDMLTRSEWQELYQAYHKWNGSGEDEFQSDGWHLMDFMAIAFLRYSILKRCEETL